MREALLKQDVIHAYETTVKLLNWRRPKKKDKDKGKGKNKALNVGGQTGVTGKTTTSYFWVYAAPVWMMLYKNLLSSVSIIKPIEKGSIRQHF